jgi:hypothetical protein
MAGIEPIKGMRMEVDKFPQARLDIMVQAIQGTNGQPLELLSQIGGAIYSVYVDGNYAYVGETIGGYSWFRIVDISNPLAPIPLGRLDSLAEGVGFNVGSMVANGDYIYVESYTEPYTDTLTTMTIIDVSNPNTPLPVKNMNLGDVGRVLLSDG